MLMDSTGGSPNSKRKRERRRTRKQVAIAGVGVKGGRESIGEEKKNKKKHIKSSVNGKKDMEDPKRKGGLKENLNKGRAVGDAKLRKRT